MESAAWFFVTISLLLHTMESGCSSWRHQWGQWSYLTYCGGEPLTSTGSSGHRSFKMRICAHCSKCEFKAEGK